MLPKDWSFENLAPPINASTLDASLAEVGHLADHEAVQALRLLLQRGWLRQVVEWRLTEVIVARLLLNDHGWLVKEPESATLVMLNGNTSAAERFLRWEHQQDPSYVKARHFGVVPYGRSLSQGLLSEYRLKDENRALVRYGRQKHGDITVPFLTLLMPHGPLKLSDMKELYTKPRSWLLSFVGSTYRPGEPDMPLSYERYPIMKRLMELEVKYEREGVAAFSSEQLRRSVESLRNVSGLRSKEALVIAPMSKFPTSTGLNDAMSFRATSMRLKRPQYFRSKFKIDQCVNPALTLPSWRCT